MKIKLAILYVLLCIFFSTSSIHGQANDIRFRQISPTGGFAIDGIGKIIQDNLGYIWMGSRQGLIKYNSNVVNWTLRSKTDYSFVTVESINDIYCDDENNLWIATKDGLRIFNRKEQKTRPITYTYEDDSKSNKNIYGIIKADNGSLFIIDEHYLGYLDLTKGQLIRIGSNQIKSPSKIYLDDFGKIWIGTLSGNVFRYDPGTNDLKKLISANSQITSIYSDNENVWIGTNGEGAKQYDLKGSLIRQFSFNTSSSKSNFGDVRSILKDSSGRLWIGAYEGLFLDDGGKLIHFNPDKYPGLPHNSIYNIYEDKQGVIWIGTWSGGIAITHKKDNNFQTYRHSLSRNSISNNMVSSFLQVDDDNLLIGTEVGGLNTFDLNTERFETIALSATEKVINIKTLCKDKEGGIWIGTHRQGLWYKKKGDNKYTWFKEGPDDGNHISSSTVFSLCAVDSGVWIGTFEKGLNFYSFITNSIRHSINRKIKFPINNLSVNSIIADTDSNLWIGTIDNFMFQIHVPTSRVTKINYGNCINDSTKVTIYSLWQHSSGDIWLGTKNNGLLIYNPKIKKLRTFDTINIARTTNVFAITEDLNQRIWITTNNGIKLYDSITKTTRNFVYSDGLQSNLFCPRSIYNDNRGNLFFGGTNGFNKIDPTEIKMNERKPFTIINSLLINNIKVVHPIYSGNYTFEELTFRPDENNLRINFSADNYLLPEKNKYKYRLLDQIDNWVEIDNETSVLFSGLNAGNYVFEIVASNNDGVWNDIPTTISFKIEEFWYKTTFAYFIYASIFGIILLITSWFYIKSSKLKREIALEKLQRKNEEEIHEMKLKFFTNISHEFRTPLTLIAWPLKKLINAQNLTSEQREELNVVERNSNRLLQLINQIIDLRKLDKGKSKLNLSKIDIIEFIDEIQKGFSIEAKSREINFLFETSFSSLLIEADKDKLDTVIYNLISNAYKFVPDKGMIKVSVRKEQSANKIEYSNQLSFGDLHGEEFVEIAIEDTGSGIDSEDLLKIFNRFEKGKQQEISNTDKFRSSGIGLSICKDFTLLHHGKIIAQSNSGKGSRFTLLLPIKQQAQKILFESHKEISNLNNNKPTVPSKLKFENRTDTQNILVVEDNDDFRRFICKFLRAYYEVDFAKNGIDALAILKRSNIDLIISDVMMPKMDGYELCSIVKSQIETSHIPVILLTALSTTDNLISGLDKGADAYLTKPFDENVLLKQIENILEQRKRIHENFSQQFVSEKTIEVGGLDNFFLKKVRDVVEKNMSDETFGIEKLAEELMISRSQLHRKIKSLSGVTTTEFVNLIRLKKAIELINNGDFLFNEVAYQVGFNSQSYFNRCFKKVYDVSPREYFDNRKSKK